MHGHALPLERTGTSAYNADYIRRISAEVQTPTMCRLRRNRPHPNQDFLLPNGLNDGIELQKKVRKAVQEYLDQMFYDQYRGPSDYPRPQLTSSYEKNLLGKSAEKSYRPYPFYVETPNSVPSVSGKPAAFYERKRPTTAVLIERSLPAHLEGESKRDRSVRIKQEINRKYRIATAHPQPSKWQTVDSTVPGNKWATHGQNVSSKKRALSAPPVAQGYSVYNQATKAPASPSDMYKPVQDKLRAWAENANDYEKQIVFNLLKKASKPDQNAPSTPPSMQEAQYLLKRNKSVPMTTMEGGNPKSTSWSPYFHDLRRQQTKQRNTNSAPVKHMLGLIPNATQMPTRDQRIYRLKGQDHRVKGNPEEEKELRAYLSRIARVTQSQTAKPEKKFLIAPMHSYPESKGTGSKDYKCDVSFFQSVRAPFKSHFVIHPDFTSENYRRKKRPEQMVSHFRY